MQTIARKVGPNDQLFGAVTNKQLMELVKEKFSEHFTSTAQFSITTVNGKISAYQPNVNAFVICGSQLLVLVAIHLISLSPSDLSSSSLSPFPLLSFLTIHHPHQAVMRMEGIVRLTLMTINWERPEPTLHLLRWLPHLSILNILKLSTTRNNTVLYFLLIWLITSIFWCITCHPLLLVACQSRSKTSLQGGSRVIMS